MRARQTAGVGAALLVSALAATLSAGQNASIDVSGVLHRASVRIVEYFARAQSIMCLEKVSLQRLGMSFGADGPARFVESELRLSWEPSDENPTPTEAHTLRQVLRVNGAPPRKKDYDNCTTPEQQTSEEQPLSILLPQQRGKYTFSYDKHETVDRREAIVIAFREIRKPTVDVSLVADNENCVSFDIEGGMRGRIWIDVETHDVLRMDRMLSGLVEIPLPRKATRFGAAPSWTMERWDSSIRFKRVAFQDPEETLVLPVSASTLQVTRGAGTPRLRTSTQYVSYRRFMTGARVVPPQ
ncbi:MAG TPA: hypothetical protein VEA16_16030 [Vicinamibacterales bacterium]|nr:hypothetical protein [Vicinamibacterales bacterium]